MEKNIFDKLSDSYENFHLKDTEIQKGSSTITISPKLKLTLGWSLFVLFGVIAVLILGTPFQKNKVLSEEDKKEVLEQEVEVNEEHDTMVPYEKDADKELNAFIESYYKAITSCDNLALQDMVTDSTEYNDAESLKKKAEFITGYNDITVYTKQGLDEGSYVAFVVSSVTIAGVNSSPYDIATLYVVNGERGYRINNGTLSPETLEYIDKVKGDKDIQKIYRSIEKKNAELKEKDKSLQQFYEIISRRNIETNSAATQSEGEEESTETEEEASSEAEKPDGQETEEVVPEEEQAAPEETPDANVQ